MCPVTDEAQMDAKFKKAGLIIVGNEILKGHVRDINSSFLCKRFHAIGVKVCRISFVPDEVSEIAEEVSRFSRKFDIVVTTGGIGPTHDDITYEAIATALDDRVVLHPEMADVVRTYFRGSRDVATNPALKMALIPETSKLIYVLPKGEEAGRRNGLQTEDGAAGKKSSFPVVQVKNVYALPGMMEWLEHAFDHLQTIFENPEVSIYTMTLFLRCSEVKVLNELNESVARFYNRVIFGSYPSNFAGCRDFATKIILEGVSLDDVTSAYAHLKSSVPAEEINDELQGKNAELVQDLTNGNKSLSKAVSNSLKVIKAALEKYEESEIYLSFNGGKDCTVLLHLVWAASQILGKNIKLNSVYIKSESVFPEVDGFVTRATTRYKMNLFVTYGAIKVALAHLHESHPDMKAIFMGTRRTDPFSDTLKEFQMCDAGWPAIMRVNPILDWTYHDIWTFLRVLDVPYCKLYDEGYTSLGNPLNTKPNPVLRTTSGGYLPAYRLTDESLERHGRK